MRGRKPISNQMKVLRGTDKPYKMRSEIPPVSPMGIAKAQTDKGYGKMTKRAREIYQHTAAQMAALGVMDDSYVKTLCLYGIWMDIAFTAAENLNSKNLVTNGKEGMTINSFVHLLDKATKNANDIGRQFGLTPITRNNIQQKQEEISPVEALEKLMNV